MFTTFPSLPNPVPHDLHIARDKRYVAQWNKYDVFIEKTAKSMISDFNKTKQALDTAINFYLKAIEDKFFRNQGRNRAQELQSNIRNSNSTLELMNALKEVVDEGNEDQSSENPYFLHAR